MLSELLNEAIEDLAEDFSQGDLEVILESNPALIEMLDAGWMIDEAIDQLSELLEFKVSSPADVEKKRAAVAKGRSAKNLRRGNPGNNPWSDYGSRGPKGSKKRGAGTGGTKMHDALADGGRSKTGQWSCKCSNYKCKCKGKGGATKAFTIDRERHLSYNARYKASKHPRKDHPYSVGA